MLKRDDDLKGLDIEICLDEHDLAVLATHVRQPGFDILQKLMEDQVRKFNLKLINTNPADQSMVVANHYLAKAVAQFYKGLMDKVEECCQVNAYNSRTMKVVESDIAIPEVM